jgi:hypothetical protein
MPLHSRSVYTAPPAPSFNTALPAACRSCCRAARMRSTTSGRSTSGSTRLRRARSRERNLASFRSTEKTLSDSTQPGEISFMAGDRPATASPGVLTRLKGMSMRCGSVTQPVAMTE